MVMMMVAQKCDIFFQNIPQQGKVCCRNMKMNVMQPGDPIVAKISALADFLFLLVLKQSMGHLLPFKDPIVEKNQWNNYTFQCDQHTKDQIIFRMDVLFFCVVFCSPGHTQYIKWEYNRNTTTVYCQKVWAFVTLNNDTYFSSLLLLRYKQNIWLN